MTADPLVLLGAVNQATERLQCTAAALDEAALAGASLLPSWSRGHVLTHLSRSADGMVNLLAVVRTRRDPQPAALAAARPAQLDMIIRPQRQKENL